MSSPLLTIIVPTYKRSANLAILLGTLREETVAVASDVVVYVSDNCSPDDTPDIVARAAEDWPPLRSHRHPTNVGPDRNFLHAVNEVQTRWFWIIGDDDLPKRSVITKIVALLRQREPALIYLESEWVRDVLSPDQGDPVGELRVAQLKALNFAANVNVWTTFISGVIVDRNRLQQAMDGHSIDRFSGSHLGQLAWVLPMLKTTGPFLLVNNRCVLATRDNSGGYGPLTVFGVNFTRIVKETFGATSPLARAMIQANIIEYLPGAIWSSRRTSILGTSYTAESPWQELNKQLGAWWIYWLLLVPLGRFPRWLGHPFYLAWRVTNRLRLLWRRRVGVPSDRHEV